MRARGHEEGMGAWGHEGVRAAGADPLDSRLQSPHCSETWPLLQLSHPPHVTHSNALILIRNSNQPRLLPDVQPGRAANS